MTVNVSIPVLREQGTGESAAANELAWMGALILLVLLVFAGWGKLRGTRFGQKDLRGDQLKLTKNWLNRLQGRSCIAPSVLGSIHLTPMHTLHDVEWQGRRLLVGCSAQFIQVLSESSSTEAFHDGQGHRSACEKEPR